ncbi:MAG: F0F1 ATP synthase subunit B' [Rhodospirillales bacterium]|nr:MAG: F0F1 ATP synthase subunit B' [Rhodospirillales bacterium]
MPQLDTAFFATQLFWLAVTFVVFYLLMSKLALPAIGETLKRREDKIQGDLDAALKAKEETKSVIALYEKALADARGEAQALARKTADAADAEAAKRQHEVSQRIAGELAGAERRIADARAAAMANVRSMAAEVARSAFTRLVGAPADAVKVDAAVDAALKRGA